MGYSVVRESFEDGSINRYVYHNDAEPLLVNGYPLAGTQTNWLNGSLMAKEVYVSAEQLCETNTYDYMKADRCETIKGYAFFKIVWYLLKTRFIVLFLPALKLIHTFPTDQ